MSGKAQERWFSERLGMESTVVRWGDYGTPVMVFPSAGGDAEEIERHGLVDACGQLLAAGRAKLYSCHSIAGLAMVERWGSPDQRMRLLNQFHQYVRWEVLPAIHADSGGEVPVLTAGASIGAFNALALLCRFPEAITAAVCMSGTYDLQPLYGGEFADDLYFSSPLHFLPGLEGPQLDRVRTRFAILASGEGAWEDIGQTWRIAHVLGSKGIPNRVDSWGADWEHDWATWRTMLPRYLDELT
jgi:esterase/lipase superfamily enzyme